MDAIIPGASKNTGIFKSSKYGDGEHILEIKEATWDTSKFDTKKEATLILKTIITDGPDKEDGRSPIGGKYTVYLKQRYEADEEWMIESDTTKIVAFFNVADLKIPKSDKLPIKELVGRSVVAVFKNRSYIAKDGTEKDVCYVVAWKQADE